MRTRVPHAKWTGPVTTTVAISDIVGRRLGIGRYRRRTFALPRWLKVEGPAAIHCKVADLEMVGML